MFDESFRLPHELVAFRSIHPCLKVRGRVETHDGRPKSSLLVRRLEERAFVIRIFGLGGLDARRPLPIRVLLAGFDLRKNDLRDTTIGTLSGVSGLHDFAEVAAFKKRNSFGNDVRSLLGFLPDTEVLVGSKIQDDRPFVAVRSRRRNNVAADETGKFSDDKIVVGLPGGEFRIHSGAKLDGGDDDRWRAHDLFSASLLNMRSALKGRLVKRMPVASLKALAKAGAMGLMGLSLMALAPSGPIVSYVSAK